MGLMGVAGCASWGLKPSCDTARLQWPSFFAQEQVLVAFKVEIEAGNNVLDGILQIKKLHPETYQAVLFSVVGGYKLMQAQVTPQGVSFDFIAPQADKTPVRTKASRFLLLLLFPPHQYQNCRESGGVRTVAYGGEGGGYYQYVADAVYPQTLTYRGTFGTAHMSFNRYVSYKAGAVPQQISYSDGAVQAEMVLFRMKETL